MVHHIKTMHWYHGKGQKILNILLLLSVVFAVIAFFNEERFPPPNGILEATVEPVEKSETIRKSFVWPFDGDDIGILPRQDIEFTGIVVTTAYDRERGMQHACVVWGENAKHPDLQKVVFLNNPHDCRTAPLLDLQFDKSDFANYRLIAINPDFVKIIRDLMTGDQIFVRGSVVDLEHIEQWYAREVTATDTEFEKAKPTEIVYVDEIEVVVPATNVWGQVMWGAIGWVVFLIFLKIALAVGHVYAEKRHMHQRKQYIDQKGIRFEE